MGPEAVGPEFQEEGAFSGAHGSRLPAASPLHREDVHAVHDLRVGTP